MRRAFTLVELLVAIAILGLLAAVAMSAMANLEQRAKEERTKTIIKRIDTAIMEKWESIRDRPLPLTMPRDIDPGNAATIRLRAMRDIQRMELPERAPDVDLKLWPNWPADTTLKLAPINLAYGLTYPTGHPKAGQSVPKTELKSAPASFRRIARIIDNLSPVPWVGRPGNSRDNWGDQYAQAELLYLILSGMRDGESSPLDFIAASETGDTDGDGLKEILDGWGRPIWFLRWPVGYVKELPIATGNKADTNQSNTSADPFDPFKRDASGYGLRPLIVSGGPDGLMDIYLEYNAQNDRTNDIRYADPTTGNAYYPVNIFLTTSTPEGLPYDLNGDGVFNWVDNITNQAILP